jgi:putative oxidoreductase
MLNLFKPTLAPLFLRAGLGAVFAFHGGLKVSVDGGTNWAPQSLGLSSTLQVVIAWWELVGGLALLAGLLTRVVAVLFAIEMVVAVFLVTGPSGFVAIGLEVPAGPAVHGFGFKAVGAEYNYLIVSICLALLVLGSGTYSLDQLIWYRRKAAPEAARPLETAPMA